VASIHHIAVRAFDLAALATQWQRATGFAPLDRGEHHALLAAPNAYVELLPAPKPAAYHPVNLPGITHACVQAHAMPPLHGAFAHAGAAFHSTPIRLATGNLYCYARDAEHNVIELEALPYAPPAQQPWLAHVAFASHDAARLAAFYAALLAGGTTTAPRIVPGPMLGPNTTYDALLALQDAVMRPTWVIGANLMLECWQFAQPPLPPGSRRQPDTAGYDHVAFEVDALEPAIDRALAAGATLLARGIAWFGRSPHALLSDPDGNRFELLAARHPFRLRDRPQPALVQEVEARNHGAKEHS
jgi:catechol 2,3-dioxygenase-like lactoylglutathione lyase family enzyme